MGNQGLDVLFTMSDLGLFRAPSRGAPINKDLMASTRYIQLLLLLSSALACQSPVASAEDEKHHSKKNWPSWGRDQFNQRHAHGLTVYGAQTLKLDWMRTLKGDMAGTPSVVDGFLYVSDQTGYTYKIRECDGEIVWQRKLSDLVNPNWYTAVIPTSWPSVVSRTTPTVVKDMVIIALQGPAALLALRICDGSLIWQTRLDAHPWAVLTQSPNIVDGVIYQGVTSLEEAAAINPAYPCCSAAGSMAAVRLSDGLLLWQTRMIPIEMTGVGKYSGCGVWGSMAPVDEKNVYIGTGNLYALPESVAACQAACDEDPASCMGQPPCVDPAVLFDAVVALDKTNGAIVWATRLQATDAWNAACIIGNPENCPIPKGPDFDFGQAPILFGKDGLVIGQKSGVVWSLDRRTGAVRWSTIGGPGGVTGGLQWGSALVEDKKGGATFYGGSANSLSLPHRLVNGLDWTGGSVIAIDAYTGRIKWEVPVPKPAFVEGPISVTDEVVFASSYQTGTMYAFAAADGELLWQFQTNGSMVAGPAISSNRIYFGNGYHFLTPGRNLYAFEAYH